MLEAILAFLELGVGLTSMAAIGGAMVLVISEIVMRVLYILESRWGT